MATAGTVLVNLIATTTKFSGPMNKARRDVFALERQIFRLKGIGAPPPWLTDFLKGTKKGIGGALTGQLLKGGVIGGGAFGAGLLGVELLKGAFNKLRPVVASAFEDIRLNLLGIPKFARVAGKSIDELSQSYVKLQAANQKQLAKTQEKVQGAFGLDRVRPLGFLNELETIAARDRRAALEKARMDAIIRFQSLAFAEDRVTRRRGRQAFIDRGIRELQLRGESTLFKRPELGARFDQETAKLNDEIARIGRQMTELDTLVKRTEFTRGLQGIGQRFATAGSRLGLDSLASRFQFALQQPAVFATNRLRELFDAPNALGRLLGRSIAGFAPAALRADDDSDEILNRVLRLQSQEFQGPQLAVKGTNEFLKAIHDDGKEEQKDIAELVRIAKQQLAAEKRQADEIAAEIARQRVTVNMP